MLAASARASAARWAPKNWHAIPSANRWRRKWRAYWGSRAAELLLTNGVDEAIHLLCETYLEPGDEALIVVPTYSMYRIYMMAAGAQVVSVPAGKDFVFPRMNCASGLRRARG